MNLTKLIAATLVLGLGACAHGHAEAPATTFTPDAATPSVSADEGHELLLATLWVQRAAEYDAATMGVYASALARLDDALADPEWTASVEQEAAGGYQALPPAIVLDVDETVLSNVAYQARLILEGGVYSSATWKAWCDEARATPIAGALELCQTAAERGVAVFYVTNRRSDVDAVTEQNLRAQGFPLSDDEDRVLTLGEREGWTGDKSSRRRYVAERYRIVQAFGDNLGDFIDIEPMDEPERDALVRDRGAWWGTRWFMIANPMYGSWESELTEDLPRESRDRATRLARKRELLDRARD